MSLIENLNDVTEDAVVNYECFENHLRSSCNRCVKDKKKCDGGRPVCYRCEKLAGSCEYSLLKGKPGRPKRNIESSSHQTKKEKIHKKNYEIVKFTNNASVGDEVYRSPVTDITLQHINPTFLSYYLECFENLFPFIDVGELGYATDAMQQGKWQNYVTNGNPLDARDSACFTSLWTALATGALLQGNSEEAARYCMNANFSNCNEIPAVLSDHTVNTAIGRAELQLSLFHHYMGDSDKCVKHFEKAAEIGRVSPEFLGSVKAFKIMCIVPKGHFVDNVNAFFFADDELKNFSMDAKLFYKWHGPYFHHLIYDIEDYIFKWKCYEDLLAAEQQLSKQLKPNPRNWGRVQFVLCALEASHAHLFEKAIQRARDLLFHIEHNKFLALYVNLSDHVLETAMDMIAFIFYSLGDFEHYEKTRKLWNSFVAGVGNEKSLLPMMEMDFAVFTDNSVRNKLREILKKSLSQYQASVGKGEVELNFEEAIDFFFTMDGEKTSSSPTIASGF